MFGMQRFASLLFVCLIIKRKAQKKKKKKKMNWLSLFLPDIEVSLHTLNKEKRTRV